MKDGARREVSGPCGRSEEPGLMEHRSLGRTRCSESCNVSSWQECVDCVAGCVPVASFGAPCVLVESERHVQVHWA
eukprot:11868819-Alexandrium_andersonii.AAC.1